jgi:hypothetical protein
MAYIWIDEFENGHPNRATILYKQRQSEADRARSEALSL